MNNSTLLSDLLIILKMYAPKNAILFIFDPFERLIMDTDFPLKAMEEDAPKVLISFADEVACYKGMKLGEFELVLDFGKSKLPTVFGEKRFNYINNPDNSMRWLYSDQNKWASFLSFYNMATLRAKVIAATIKIAFKLGFKSLIKSGSFSIHYQAELKIDSLISQIPHDEYSIFMGTVGINRTVLIELNTKGETTHFIKNANTKPGIKALSHEGVILNGLKLKDFKSFAIPKVISSYVADILITKSIKPKNAQRSNQLTPLHYNALSEMAFNPQRFSQLKSTTYWNETLHNISLLKKKGNYTKVIAKLVQLRTELNDVKHVYMALAHSDFTPWNIFTDHKKLYVYDWEDCEMETPMLYDLFHFHFQKGVLSERISVQQIKANILAACENKKIKNIISTYRINVETYFKMYLLKIITKYIGVFQQQNELNQQHNWLLTAYNEVLDDTCSYVSDKVHRNIFVKDFGQELNRTDHAFLKFTEGSLENLESSSDLDILVLKGDIKMMVKYCKSHISVQRINTYQKSFMTTVELFFKDGSFLSIDLINQFKRKGIQFMDAKSVLVSALPNRYGVVVPEAKFDFEYCFLFHTLNGASISKKYKAHYSEQNRLQHSRIFKYIDKKYKLVLCKEEELFNYNQCFNHKILEIIEANSSSNMAVIKNKMNYVLDTIKDIMNRKGMVITFSGVDGAGKSTIIEQVKNRLKSKYRKEVVLLRHRPGILPILSAIKHGKEEAEHIASVTLPRKGKNNNIFSSVARFAYYFTDYMIGQVYVYFKYVLRGKIVLYDRYYFDFINDAKRSNIQLNRSFVKALYRLVFKPKLNFFLYADAATILERKQEMIAPEIDELTILYKQLFGQMSSQYKLSHYTIIENKDLNVTLDTIMNSYAKLA